MDSRTYYYARVSSKEQNLDRQIAAFKALGATDREIITDKESGKDLERAGYQALKNAMLRRGDTLVVKSLDRLSRNKCDIHNELWYFKENGIRLKVIDLPTTMMDLPEGQEWVFDMVNNILIGYIISIIRIHSVITARILPSIIYCLIYIIICFCLVITFICVI